MKIIFLIVGLISLAIGSVGVVLPVLPTTPFLLVSAYCFARSSKKVEAWFKSTNLYKKNLDSFVKGEGMDIKTKARILRTITLLLIVAAFAMRNVPYGFLIILSVWFLHVVIFIFFIKTAKEETPR